MTTSMFDYTLAAWISLSLSDFVVISDYSVSVVTLVVVKFLSLEAAVNFDLNLLSLGYISLLIRLRMS